jgi:hypothetical protein
MTYMYICSVSHPLKVSNIAYMLVLLSQQVDKASECTFGVGHVFSSRSHCNPQATHIM